MLLRIEDTDRERSTPENVEQIFDALRWLELDWDGDPIFQSQRADRHARRSSSCSPTVTPTTPTPPPTTCAPTRSATATTRAFAARPRTRARCGCGCGEGDTAARRRPHPRRDDVRARAHGRPGHRPRRRHRSLYNFAVAVDDLDAGITHVVRGEDHLSNTPKQLVVLEALGAQPPAYAHLPLLHGPDGKKLSKRHGAASVQELRDAGYLPEAVRNYLALLGWGHEDDTKLSTDELHASCSASRTSRATRRASTSRSCAGSTASTCASSARRADRPAGGVHGPRGPARGRGDHPGEDPDAGGLLAAGRLPLRRPGRRPGGVGAGHGARRAPGDAGPGARGAGRAPSRSTWRRSRPRCASVVERRGVKPKEVFQPVRVAIAGTHRFTRDLRERRGPGPRRDPAPDRRRAGAAEGQPPISV